MSAALAATGLGRSFRTTWALRSCSLDIQQGSVTALVGPNGAGKSTLLQLAVGLLRPTEGSITVFGHAPGSSAEALAEVGYLAQDHPLYRPLTVADHLRMGRDMNPRWDSAFARTHIESSGIPLDRRAGSLSGGQQARLALTLALASRPSLLVLDEPVASLDPVARRDFMTTVLTDSADRGTTVILSSHVTAGQVQVDGEIDALLARHRHLAGSPEIPRPRVRQVLSEAVTAREVSLVVELDEPVADPRWTSSPISLEELTLAYLRDPEAGTRSHQLRAIGGTR